MNSQTVLMLVTSTSKTRAELNKERLCALERAIQCGTPGCSGFNDQWGRKLSCPGYNIN